MAGRVLIIDGKEPNAGVGGVSAADFSHFSNRFLTPGVLSDTDYLVEAQDTPDMSVKFAAGKAYVPNTAETFNIPVEDETGGNVAIEPNVSGNDRIDTIVIAIDEQGTPNENADNIIDVVTLQGTPASSPSPLTDNEIQTALGAGYAWLKLAEVTVENGAVSITDSDVSDARQEVGFLLSAGGDGWTEAGETWAYASADDPSFTFTVSGDQTAKYSPGMRVKLTQTTTKYFIITKVVHSGGTTTITLYGGTDYDLVNATITDPYYSTHKAPQGFPLDPAKWTVELSDTAARSQTSPTKDAWHNLGSLSLAIPIGVWDVSYQVAFTASGSSGQDNSGKVTLSTADNSESDSDFTTYQTMYFGTGSVQSNNTHTLHRQKVLSLASKTTYYLNGLSASSQNSGNSIAFNGDKSPTKVRAVSAYL